MYRRYLAKHMEQGCLHSVPEASALRRPERPVLVQSEKVARPAGSRDQKDEGEQAVVAGRVRNENGERTLTSCQRALKNVLSREKVAGLPASAVLRTSSSLALSADYRDRSRSGRTKIAVWRSFAVPVSHPGFLLGAPNSRNSNSTAVQQLLVLVPLP